MYTLCDISVYGGGKRTTLTYIEMNVPKENRNGGHRFKNQF